MSRGFPRDTGNRHALTGWDGEDGESETATGFTAGAAVTVPAVIVCMVTAVCQTALCGSIVADRMNALDALVVLAAILVALLCPLVLLRRNRNPERTCIEAAAFTAAVPIGPLLAVTALASLIARRLPTKRTRAIEAAAVASLIITSVRDAVLPGNASFVRFVLADYASGAAGSAGDGASAGTTAVSTSMALLVDLVFCALWIAVACLVGSNERHHALERASLRRNAVQRSESEHLRTALNGQQFADAVAAEAHDTLAHSLSLIALNSNMLKMQADALQRCLGASNDSDGGAERGDSGDADPGGAGLSEGNPLELAANISIAAENIRRQAAGALDEVHGIISVLRDPQSHTELLSPGAETSLTYESLNSLVDDARSSGMPLDSWIDVRDVTAVSPVVGKLAYRIIQEGLTNAQRHAPGQRVSLAVSCNRDQGVVIRFSNPCIAQSGPRQPVAPSSGAGGNAAGNDGMRGSTDTGAPAGPNSGGNGLPGLKQRVDDIGGSITWSVDWRGIFHLDATLPLTPLITHD